MPVFCITFLLLCTFHAVAAGAADYRICGWMAVDGEQAELKPDRTPRDNLQAPGVAHLVRFSKAASVGASGAHCGAAHIAPGWILTARHCVDGIEWSDMHVDLGSAALGSESHGLTRRGELALCPNATDPGSLQGDLALVRLNENIPATARPADLLTDPVAIWFPADVALASWPAAGMGIGTPNLRILPLRATAATPTGHVIGDLAKLGTRAPCGGESGAPIYLEHQGRVVLAGVLSAIVTPGWWKKSGRPKCLAPQTRVLFSPVAPWADWISDTIAACEARAETCVRPE